MQGRELPEVRSLHCPEVQKFSETASIFGCSDVFCLPSKFLVFCCGRDANVRQRVSKSARSPVMDDIDMPVHLSQVSGGFPTVESFAARDISAWSRALEKLSRAARRL